MVEFFSRNENTVTATRDGESIQLSIDGKTFELSREAATDLQSAVGDALTERCEFFRTAGTFREDGSYEVSRRGADSAGNAKVFRSFDVMARLFDRLPDEFTAEDVGRTGITGSRRHLLVRHFGEHPDFRCRISSRNPLTAEKGGGTVDADGNAEVRAD